MSSFFDNFGEKATGLFNTAKEKAVELGTKGAALAKETADKAKDKAQELKLNSQLRDNFAKLGEAFYESSVNGVEFAGKDELLATITSIKQTLADLADKAAAVEETVEEAAEEAAEEAVETAEETVEEAVEETVE